MVRPVRGKSKWWSHMLIACATLALAASVGERVRADVPTARVPNSDKALDVVESSAQNRAALIRHAVTSGANQRWLLGLASGPASEDGPSTQDVVRFLEQATWGPTPALIEHVKQVGFEAF